MIVDELKKAILQYGIQGKLTIQNTKDITNNKTEKLTNLVDIYTGNSISENIKKTKYTNLEEGFNYIATKDISFESTIDYRNGIKIPFDEPKFKYAYPNDILLCIEGGSAGRKIGIVEEQICFGNKLCCFHTEKLNNKYLYYYLQSPQFLAVFQDNLSGIIGGVSINKIKNIQILCPPLEEQQRIVDKVDGLFGELDKLKYTEMKLNELKDKFPGEIRKSVLNKYLNIGDCEIEKLSNLVDIYTGNSISENIKKTKYTNLEEGFNYIATKDISFESTIDYRNGIKIPFDEPKFKYAYPNDILLCIEGGSAGRKIGIVEEQICFGNKLCCFHTEKLNNKYLYYYLQSPQFLGVFQDNLSGIIGGVSISKIKNIQIPLPPIEEQQRIVDKLDEILPIIDSL